MPHRKRTHLDPTALRRTLGRFATGITVISMRRSDGSACGLTVNSFNSVSLDPPLIVWSLARRLPIVADFEHCSHFAVNVLASGQEALSRRFATRDAHPFAGLAWREGANGVPLLEGCCAWFECRNAIRHEGGDHLVFLGEVEAFANGEGEPLIYFGGRYRQLAGE